MEYRLKAWCKKHKLMYDVCSLQFIGDKISVNDNKDCIGEEIILLPTGVKDINKKESYLGDILKGEGEEHGIVKKEEDSNNMYLEWYHSVKVLNKTKWYTTKLSINNITLCSIAGNIYSNPDIIKKEGE